MKHLILFLIWGTFSVVLHGQTLSKSIVDFGEVETGAPDSQQVMLTNNTSGEIMLKQVFSFHAAFIVKDTLLKLMPSEAYSFWIKFNPRHNIQHNSEVVLDLAGRYGTLLIDVRGMGKYPGTYYSSTQNLSEEALKSVLKTLISGHTSYSYNEARDKMFMQIDNKKVNGQGASVNTLECVYTGREAVGYTSRSDAQNNYSFNTEHTFPQSLFNSLEPMRTDLFHLFPTDVAANSERANNPFGNVTNASWSVGGSKSNGSTFEPRDEQKGVTARAMFYFVIRYQDYSNFEKPQEPVLRDWAMQFPPDAVEQQRNEDIFAVQHNRNPFIDHPEFLERIHAISGTSTAPVVIEAAPAEDTIDLGGIVVDSAAPYEFHLYAGGNTDLTISNAHFDQAGFSITASPASISPGEDGVFSFTYTPIASGSINAVLTFETNDPDNGTLEIPVTGLAVMTGLVDRQREEAKVAIVNGQLLVTLPGNAEAHVAVFDISGKRILDSNTEQLYFERLFNFSKGIYLYSIIQGDKIFRGKVIAR